MNIRQFKTVLRKILFIPIDGFQLKIALGSFFLLWFILGIRISQFQVQEGFWIASSDDDFANLYRQSLSLSSPSTRPQIILIASSSIREALLHPEQFLPRLRSLPKQPDLRLLTAGDLNQIEMAQLLSSLPEQAEGVLFLEVSERIFGLSPELLQLQISKSRLPDAPLRYQTFLIKQGLRPPILPNHGAFYAARMQPSWKALAPREKWNFHQIGFSEKRPTSDYPELSELLINWAALSEEHSDWNLQFFQQLIQLAPPKMKLIFILPPRNPEVERLANESEIYSQQRIQFQSKLESLNIPIISIHREVSADDYTDHGHIWNETARIQCTEEFLFHVQEAMRADEH